MRRNISAHVDGGPSGRPSVRRPGSEDPLGVNGNFIWKQRKCSNNEIYELLAERGEVTDPEC